MQHPRPTGERPGAGERFASGGSRDAAAGSVRRGGEPYDDSDPAASRTHRDADPDRDHDRVPRASQGDGGDGTPSTKTPAKSLSDRLAQGQLHVKGLIRCAARHFGVSVDKAVGIAFRESRFHPRAYNSWSCAKGIYQHLCRYWPDPGP